MHPAYSVIFFTTASGAGYGLLALVGVLSPLGLAPQGRLFGFFALGLALTLVTTGLLASTHHLGRPERAWRAVARWRTSWLAREGLAALATYLPASLFGLLWLGWGHVSLALGALTALGAVVTLFCTAMIYRSLKPVQRWCNHWVVPNYLALGLMTGALWLFAMFGTTPLLPLAAIVAAAVLKLLYWRFIDTTRSASTAESATGLGRFGKVRQLEAPHTEDNYLLREMGYRVARQHARRLRLVALALGFGLPFGLCLAGFYVPSLGILAALCAMGGVLVERWLFFAEARHTVTLFYGAATA